jgi:hypothetical protein
LSTQTDLTVRDFDIDGQLDVLQMNGGSINFLKGRGDGTFNDLRTQSAIGLTVPASLTAVGDVNGDGKLDLVFPFSNTVWLGGDPYYPTDPVTTDHADVLLGYGDGSFAPAITQTLRDPYPGAGRFQQAVLKDFNGDGRADLAVSNPGTNHVDVALNQGGWSPLPAALRIDDVKIVEGNAGTKNALFTVTLNAGGAQTVTVDYATVGPPWGWPASPGVDYITVSGTLTFLPGEKTKTIAVPIKGDAPDEYDEQFGVNLAGPTNAILIDGQGVGVILDDDATPTLSISDVTRKEGNSGFTKFDFVLTLSAPSGRAINASYMGHQGTTDDADFRLNAPNGFVMAAGQTSYVLTVDVVGDTKKEPVELFYMDLFSDSNAIIPDSHAVGTILDDDGPNKTWIGPATGGSWSTASNWSPGGVPGTNDDVPDRR